MKRCSKCKKIKPSSDFNKDRKNKDRLRGYCKSCKKVSDGNYKQSAKGKEVQRKSNMKYQNSLENKDYQKRYQPVYYRTLSQTIRGRLKFIFKNMLQRCNNSKNKAYKYYGNRGIKVKFIDFDNFYDYVVNILKADTKGLTIDRIDNDGDYEQGNIRFVTQAENNRNKRDRLKG